MAERKLIHTQTLRVEPTTKRWCAQASIHQKKRNEQNQNISHGVTGSSAFQSQKNFLSLWPLRNMCLRLLFRRVDEAAHRGQCRTGWVPQRSDQPAAFSCRQSSQSDCISATFRGQVPPTARNPGRLFLGIWLEFLFIILRSLGSLGKSRRDQIQNLETQSMDGFMAV